MDRLRLLLCTGTLGCAGVAAIPPPPEAGGAADTDTGAIGDVQGGGSEEPDPVVCATATSEIDWFGDENIEERTIAWWGPDNQPLRTERDDLGDGTVEVTWEWVYDAAGVLESWQSVGVEVWLRTYSYADEVSTELLDLGSDGTIEAIEVSTWDRAGNLLRSELDEDADGEVDWVLTQTFDPSGQQLTEQIDDDADGTFESTWTFTWEDARLVVAEGEWEGDGAIDTRAVYTYDAAGNLVLLDVEDLDGTFDTRTTWIYDDDGNRLTSEYDISQDGTVDLYFTWEYDADSNLILEEERGPYGVVVRRSHVWSFDPC